MSTQHTPGPWVSEDRGYKCIVHKPGGGYITRDVCRMDGSTMAAFEQGANAALIAAAPELLSALKDARRKLAWFTDSYPQDIVVSESEFFGPIDAAITKATGGTK